MTGLRISRELLLPLDAVTQTFGILARRGAGKTYTGKVLTEEMVEHDLPVVVIDPLGVWWGLRSGLPVTILGGAHGDVELNEHSGAEVAQFLVESPTPMVLDLSSIETKSGQIRFMTAFAEKLYRLKANDPTPLHLMIDEADEFAPQRSFPEGARLLGAMEALVRRGRARGIGCTLITQRAAVLNKNVLTQVECLIVMQTTGPQDKTAVKAWVEGNADDGGDVIRSLPSLKTGQAWVWSPSWLRTCQLVQVREAKTFDSSATPKPGEARKPVKLMDVDLSVLSDRLLKAAEEVKDNDPKELKRRIRELEKQLAGRPSEKEIETVEVPVVLDMSKLLEACEYASGAQTLLHDAVVDFSRRMNEVANQTPERTTRRTELPPKSLKHEVETLLKVDIDTDIRLSKPERKVLSVLATHGATDRTKLQLLAGVRGGYLNNTLGALRSKGLATPDWPVTVTAEGRNVIASIGHEELPDPGDSLFDWWMRHPKMNKPGRQIMYALKEHGPQGRDELQELAEVRGGYFNNTVGMLRTMDLVTKGWPVELAEELR